MRKKPQELNLLKYLQGSRGVPLQSVENTVQEMARSGGLSSEHDRGGGSVDEQLPTIENVHLFDPNSSQVTATNKFVQLQLNATQSSNNMSPGLKSMKQLPQNTFVSKKQKGFDISNYLNIDRALSESSSTSSSFKQSTYSKDKNWKKLQFSEQQRLRKRIIRDMIKIETNVLRNKTVDHLQEVKQTAQEIQHTIESNKISKMVEQQNDKLARYYQAWVASKLKEFEDLKQVVLDKINRKDKTEEYIMQLEAELQETMAVANKYFGNFRQLQTSQKGLRMLVEEQYKEINQIKKTLKNNRKLTQQLQEQNASIREDLRMVGDSELVKQRGQASRDNEQELAGVIGNESQRETSAVKKETRTSPLRKGGGHDTLSPSPSQQSKQAAKLRKIIKILFQQHFDEIQEKIDVDTVKKARTQGGKIVKQGKDLDSLNLKQLQNKLMNVFLILEAKKNKGMPTGSDGSIQEIYGLDPLSSADRGLDKSERQISNYKQVYGEKSSYTEGGEATRGRTSGAKEGTESISRNVKSPAYQMSIVDTELFGKKEMMSADAHDPKHSSLSPKKASIPSANNLTKRLLQDLKSIDKKMGQVSGNQNRNMFSGKQNYKNQIKKQLKSEIPSKLSMYNQNQRKSPYQANLIGNSEISQLSLHNCISSHREMEPTDKVNQQSSETLSVTLLKRDSQVTASQNPIHLSQIKHKSNEKQLRNQQQNTHEVPCYLLPGPTNQTTNNQIAASTPRISHKDSTAMQENQSDSASNNKSDSLFQPGAWSSQNQSQVQKYEGTKTSDGSNNRDQVSRENVQLGGQEGDFHEKAHQIIQIQQTELKQAPRVRFQVKKDFDITFHNGMVANAADQEKPAFQKSLNQNTASISGSQTQQNIFKGRSYVSDIESGQVLGTKSGFGIGNHIIEDEFHQGDSLQHSILGILHQKQEAAQFNYDIKLKKNPRNINSILFEQGVVHAKRRQEGQRGVGQAATTEKRVLRKSKDSAAAQGIPVASAVVPQSSQTLVQKKKLISVNQKDAVKQIKFSVFGQSVVQQVPKKGEKSGKKYDIRNESISPSVLNQIVIKQQSSPDGIKVKQNTLKKIQQSSTVENSQDFMSGDTQGPGTWNKNQFSLKKHTGLMGSKLDQTDLIKQQSIDKSNTFGVDEKLRQIQKDDDKCDQLQEDQLNTIIELKIPQKMQTQLQKERQGSQMNRTEQASAASMVSNLPNNNIPQLEQLTQRILSKVEGTPSVLGGALGEEVSLSNILPADSPNPNLVTRVISTLNIGSNVENNGHKVDMTNIDQIRNHTHSTDHFKTLDQASSSNLLPEIAQTSLSSQGGVQQPKSIVQNQVGVKGRNLNHSVSQIQRISTLLDKKNDLKESEINAEGATTPFGTYNNLNKSKKKPQQAVSQQLKLPRLNVNLDFQKAAGVEQRGYVTSNNQKLIGKSSYKSTRILKPDYQKNSMSNLNLQRNPVSTNSVSELNIQFQGKLDKPVFGQFSVLESNRSDQHLGHQFTLYRKNRSQDRVPGQISEWQVNDLMIVQDQRAPTNPLISMHHSPLAHKGPLSHALNHTLESNQGALLNQNVGQGYVKYPLNQDFSDLYDFHTTEQQSDGQVRANQKLVSDGNNWISTKQYLRVPQIRKGRRSRVRGTGR